MAKTFYDIETVSYNNGKILVWNESKYQWYWLDPKKQLREERIKKLKKLNVL